MTFRQEMFCWAYLETFCNGAAAARKIGYKPRWARCQASRVLRRQDVQAFLQHIRDLTSHPRCLACDQPLLDSGYGLETGRDFRPLERILDSWERARWSMEASGEWSRMDVNKE